MTRLVKIVDNKYVQIEEYKNSNICFNTNEYSASEDCCTLRETFDPFEMFYENQGLKKQLHEASLQIQSLIEEDMTCPSTCSKLRKLRNQQKEFIEYLGDKLNMCDGFLDTIKSDLEEISYAGRASGKTYIETQIMKNEIAKKCYEEVLSIYREIIGGNNDQ